MPTQLLRLAPLLSAFAVAGFARAQEKFVLPA